MNKVNREKQLKELLKEIQINLNIYYNCDIMTLEELIDDVYPLMSQYNEIEDLHGK